MLKNMINFMVIWRAFGIFYADLVILCSFGTFFSGFSIMHQEKSGNPGWQATRIKLTKMLPTDSANLDARLARLALSALDSCARIFCPN
jgi:hypothetical protein